MVNKTLKHAAIVPIGAQCGGRFFGMHHAYRVMPLS